ncbi:MAG: hypothetical protein V8S28_03020 [Lachnospiraceae bacterium]
MIILKTNLELKLTFEKLIRTMKEPVEWNGTFVVVGDYLILQGRVRSLFFNFENRKVLTNIIDIPVKEEDVIELDNHTKVQNVLNLVLYAFGKWGMIRGVKVEQDYAQLNTLFTTVLREFAVEPGYSQENFRFYKAGIRLNYEDVIGCAIEAEEEKEKPVEEEMESGGLWHKLVWNKQKKTFLKQDTTYAQRQQNRLGNNFYMVGYQCPKCREYLHMVVFPENKEFRIETVEGGVFLARAYTCNTCHCFYTPRPEKLLAEGDVYVMDFMSDTHAYEDYLELLGSQGDRVSNYKFNEYEVIRKRKNQMQINDTKESLETICSNIDALDDKGLEVLKAKIEEGFYPAESVKYLEKAVDEAGRSPKRGNRNHVDDRQSAKDFKAGSRRKNGEHFSADGSRQTEPQSGADVRPDRSLKMNDGQSTDLQDGTGSQPGNERHSVMHSSQQAEDQQQEDSASSDGKTVSKDQIEKKEIPKTKLDTARKRYLAKCNVIDRLSPTQLESFKKELLQEKNLYDTDKEPILAQIRKREEAQKREYIQKLAAGCKGENYAKMQRAISEIEKTDLPDTEKQKVLETLYQEKKRQGEAEVASMVQKAPSTQDLKQFRAFMDRLKDYSEVDLSPYEAALKEKQKAAESREISNMIRHTRIADRTGLTELMRRLKGMQFDEQLLAPYMQKLEEKLTAMDSEALDKICENLPQMTADEALEAYQKVDEGIFLPKLKTNALEMLKKRLIKLKTDECELLVHKLQESLKGKIKENDRYHFYPARKVMMKEATEEELATIRFALDTYGTKRGLFEYPILVVDTSRNQSGKEGIILTPEHLFYRTMLNAYMIPIGDIRKVQTQTGLLNAGVSIEIKDGTKIRLPYAVDKKELPAWGSCLKDFISYLQEKPDSRNLTYLASEKHETICCFRCGYTYKGGNVCPKCGYKMNR